MEEKTLCALHWNIVSPWLDIQMGPDKLYADNLVSRAMEEDDIGVTGDACREWQELTQ